MVTLGGRSEACLTEHAVVHAFAKLAVHVRLLAKDMLVLSLLDLVEVVKEKSGVLTAIVGPRENVPRNARRPTVLHIFVAEKDIDAIIFECNCLENALIIAIIDIIEATIVAANSARRRLHELRHLLFPHILIVRVEVDLDVTPHHTLLLHQ